MILRRALQEVRGEVIPVEEKVSRPDYPCRGLVLVVCLAILAALMVHIFEVWSSVGWTSRLVLVMLASVLAVASITSCGLFDMGGDDE